jgi:hypothetical protein|uniref:thiol oxidase n=1 Tax=viral metagenome TaxID=1070528 RepID=A0A6C0K9L2_9ZZZZ
MPCPCNLPLEIYPGSEEWGPLLWKLLHGLAERAGKILTPVYAEEERHHWTHFFKMTSDIIPCDVCKEHFRIYLREHPVDALKKMPTNQIRAYVRHWFWEVHEWVNMTLNKPSFPEEDLETAYAALSLRNILGALDIPMKRAIRLSGNNQKKYTDWRAKYLSMLSIYGL